ELLDLRLGAVVGVGQGAGAADDDRLGRHDGLADDLQARVAQGGAGLDDVGDDLGDAEFDGGLHGAVEVDDGGVDAFVLQVAGDDALVGGGDRHARQVGDAVGRAGAGGEAERGAGEAQRQDLLGAGAGVDEQVPSGDADVEAAGGDVDRDVARAE